MLCRLRYLLFLVSLPIAAANMRYTNWCQQGGQMVVSHGQSSTTKVQRSYPACTVTVYLTGTVTLATIYADSSNTPLANPFTSSVVTGMFFFYAADGRYDIQLSGGGVSPPFTIGDVLFNTSTGGTGGGGTVTSVSMSVPSWLTVTGSPIVSAGTLAISPNTGQATHQFIGTGLGSSFIPTTITAADLPFTFSGNTSILGTVSGALASGHCLAADANGNVVDSGIVGCAGLGSGTVTSVTFTGDGVVDSSTPSSAVTTNGTVTVTLKTQTAHTVLGNFTGGTAAPTFGSITTSELPFTYSGNTTKLATTTGTLTNGHCVSIDANGNIVDNGGTCGTGAGGGTVTSVAMTVPTGFGISGTPITTAGTLALSMPASWATGDLLLGNGANSVSRLAIGANNTYLKSNGTTASWQSAGTVTSVGLSLPSEFTVSGTPVTTSGTLTGTWANASAHKFFGNATGISATPSFSTIGTGDLPFTYSNPANTKLATSTGTLTNGHCVSIDANGNYIDAGAACSTGVSTPGGTNGQIEWNNAGFFGGFTATGDATIVPSTGVVTVTKTAGVAFAPSATTDATNAANITSGTIPGARMPALTGDVTSTAGTVATTLATVNSNVGTCGDATHVGQVTLNAKGLATACTPILLSASSTWSALGNPTGALALTMGHNVSTWNYDATTGTSSMQTLTDTINNTGTAALWRSSTASGSTAPPWQADANGVGWQVDATGKLACVGCSGIPFTFSGLVGSTPTTPPASFVTGFFDTSSKRISSVDDAAVVTKYVGSVATVSLTGQTALIGTTNLCSTAQCIAGQYRVTAFVNSTLICATPGPAVVGLTIGWTDDASAKTFKIPVAGTGLSGTDVTLGQTTAFGQYSFNVWSTGSAAITYATNYTACTTGTGTYSIRLVTEKVQ